LAPALFLLRLFVDHGAFASAGRFCCASSTRRRLASVFHASAMPASSWGPGWAGRPPSRRATGDAGILSRHRTAQNAIIGRCVCAVARIMYQRSVIITAIQHFYSNLDSVILRCFLSRTSFFISVSRSKLHLPRHAALLCSSVILLSKGLIYTGSKHTPKASSCPACVSLVLHHFAKFFSLL
jgi:hypothetical protein